MFLAIVPAYNEEKTIADVVRGLLPVADRVVVVDDGSSDHTADIARECGAIVLRHDINRGQGAALETGHEYARSVGADFVLHFDADGQFDPRDVAAARACLERAGADILFGIRACAPVTKKYLLLPIARLFERIFFGIHLSDAHNGFRILNRRALREIHIEQDGMAHATEIPFLVRRFGLRAIEFPVSVVYREYGQGSAGGLQILRDLMFSAFLK